MYKVTLDNELGYMEIIGLYGTIDEAVKVWNELYEEYGEVFLITVRNPRGELV